MINENVMGYMVQKFPIISKDLIIYVKKNKKDFISPNDAEKTRKNISYYSEQVILNYLYDCCYISSFDIPERYKLELVDEVIANLRSDSKKGLKNLGRNIWDSFKNPIVGMVSITNVIAYFTSEWYKNTIVSNAPALFKTMFRLKEVPLHTSALGMTSFGIMISVVVILTILKMINSKDGVKVYFFNKKTKQLLTLLKTEGFREELKSVDIKTSKVYQVEKYQECLKKSCSDKEDPDKKRECIADCFFNILIGKDMPIIIDVYLKFLKKYDIPTKNIKSFSQLMDSPLPYEQRGIQQIAKEFSYSFKDILSIFYKDNPRKQVFWIDKLNTHIGGR